MRQFNSEFLLKLHDPAAEPRLTFQVSFDQSDSDLLYITSHANGNYPEGAEVIQNAIAQISNSSQSLDNRYARAEIGGLSAVIADIDGALTTALNTRSANTISPVRKKFVVYLGFDGLRWSEYEAIDTYYIDDTPNEGPGYKIKATDVQKEMRQKIMVPDKSTLSASMTATQTHVPINEPLTTAKFPTIAHDTNYSFNPSTTVGYVQVDSEKIAHSGIFNHGTDGPSLQVVERGALNTIAATHNTGSSSGDENRKSVDEVTYIEASVVDCIYFFLTGASLSGAVTIPSHWHAGILRSKLDLVSHSLLNTTMAEKILTFIDRKDIDAKQFIERQVFSFFGLYHVVDSAGILILRQYETHILNAGVVAELNNDNIVSGGLGPLDTASNDIVNVVDLKFNYNHVEGKTNRSIQYTDAESISGNGQLVKKQSYEFVGVRTARNTDNDLRNFFLQLRELYGFAPYKITVKADKTMMGLEVGDVVRLNTHMRNDFNEGTQSINRAFMVARRSIDFKKLEVKLNLIGSSRSRSVLLDPGALNSSGELTTAFLTGTGTDLETLPEVSSGVITSDLTLTGGSDANDAGSIFYIDDDLTLQTGVTLTLIGNVQIRYTGAFELEAGSIIDGRGGGLTGTAFGSANPAAGYFGSTKAGGALHRTRFIDISIGRNIDQHLGLASTVVQGAISALPVYNLVNNDGVLEGIPSDLRGSPGGPGRQAQYIDITQVSTTTTTADGGDGGDGAGSLITLGRGFIVSPTATINLSGGSGTPGKQAAGLYGGSGAGAMPSGLLVIIDGDYTPPDNSRFVANSGDSPNVALPINRGFVSQNLSDAAFRLQFVPARRVAEDSAPIGVKTLAQVTGVSAVNGSDNAVISWTAVNDEDVSGYQVQSKLTSESTYVTQAFTDTADLEAIIYGVGSLEYDVRVRAISSFPNVEAGPWATVIQHTINPRFDIVRYNLPAVAYTGKFKDLTTIDSSVGHLFMRSDDGTRLFFVGKTNDRIYSVDLDTPYDASSIDLTSVLSIDISSLSTAPYVLTFDSSGTRLYFGEYDGDDIWQLNLDTAWVLNLPSSPPSADFSAQMGATWAASISNDGTKFFILGSSGILSSTRTVYEYDLTTAYDITTRSYVQSLVVANNSQGITFSDDGKLLFARSNATITGYSLPTAFDLTASEQLPVTATTFAQTQVGESAVFGNNGKWMYAVGTDDEVFQYNSHIASEL